MASWLRYMLTPSHVTIAGRSGSKPANARRPVSESTSKSTGTNATRSGDAIPAAARRCRLLSWLAGWSTSNVMTRSASADR